MRTLATKQPTHDSAKQKKGNRGRTACSSASLSPSVSPLSTEIPLLQRKCACGGGCPRCQAEQDLEEALPIQTKLKISQPGDKYEQEADRVAEQVMRIPESAAQPKTKKEEEELLKTKPLIKSLMQTKTEEGKSVEVITTLAPQIQALQGKGSPLPESTRTFFEPRFGYDFSSVRVHTDAKSDKLNQSLQARAFTTGNDIFFGQDAGNLGSIKGKELLAHELTHVVQQAENSSGKPIIQRRIGIRGSISEHEYHPRSGCSPATFEPIGEREIIIFLNQSYIDYITRHLGDPELGIDLEAFVNQSEAEEERRSRRTLIERILQEMQISEDDHIFADYAELGREVERRAREILTEEARTRLTGFVQEILTDDQLQPPDWDSLGGLATELNISEAELSFILQNNLNFEANSANLIAFLASSENLAIRHLGQSYATRIVGQTHLQLETDPVSLLVSQSLEDGRLELSETEALRQFTHIMGIEYTEAVLEDSNVHEAIRTSLLSILRMGYLDFQALASQSGFFPIPFGQERREIVTATTDFRRRTLQYLMRRGTCEHRTFVIFRTLLGNLSEREASTVLRGAGLVASHAGLLAREFTRPEDEYQYHVERRQLLTMTFRQADEQWEMTPESYQNWSLPWGSESMLIRPLAPVQGSTERRTYTPEGVTPIGSRRFASGLVRNAEQIDFRFRGQSIPLIVAEDLVERDLSLLIRIETALSVLPANHAALIRELVIDPGNKPERSRTLADASRESFRVNFYLRGAGARVPQSDLNNTAAHEVGHLVSYQVEATDPTFWERWEQAMANDRIGISRYGFTNRSEDFAETYVIYLSGGRTDPDTRQRYSRRFAILDEIFSR